MWSFVIFLVSLSFLSSDICMAASFYPGLSLNVTITFLLIPPVCSSHHSTFRCDTTLLNVYFRSLLPLPTWAPGGRGLVLPPLNCWSKHRASRRAGGDSIWWRSELMFELASK